MKAALGTSAFTRPGAKGKGEAWSGVLFCLTVCLCVGGFNTTKFESSCILKDGRRKKKFWFKRHLMSVCVGLGAGSSGAGLSQRAPASSQLLAPFYHRSFSQTFLRFRSSPQHPHDGQKSRHQLLHRPRKRLKMWCLASTRCFPYRTSFPRCSFFPCWRSLGLFRPLQQIQ